MNADDLRQAKRSAYLPSSARDAPRAVNGNIAALDGSKRSVRDESAMKKAVQATEGVGVPASEQSNRGS
jgi:hypothetical protein